MEQKTLEITLTNTKCSNGAITGSFSSHTNGCGGGGDLAFTTMGDLLDWLHEVLSSDPHDSVMLKYN